MPNTTQSNAQAMAERLRAAVERLQFSHEGVGLRFTVSVGVSATSVAHETTAEALLAAADKALYTAKEGGRNRVELAENADASSPAMSGK